MIVGVPLEVKSDEYRVAMLPVAADLLTQAGHTVLIEKGAGSGSGYEDQHYVDAGATLVDTAEEIWERANLIVKVKEPMPAEWPLMRSGQVIFTYFHFAADRALTEACLERGIVALAYETLEDSAGRLPLLTPMSEVAGRMSIQEGAKYLEKPQMGRGILLSGVPGVEPAKVTVIGGGIVGTQAARIAAGLGANVVVMDVNLDRLRYLDDVMPPNVRTIYSDPHSIRWHCTTSDLVIGAVLIPGGRCPVLIDEPLLKEMRSGAVIVDVGVDQGGCCSTTRPTTHADPTFVVHDVVHYCVANMPGAVGRTSTQALCHATQPFVIRLAAAVAGEKLDDLIATDHGFKTALNLRDGQIANDAVANALK